MFKELLEKKALLQAEMQGMLDTANGEQRALTEEEQRTFDEKDAELTRIEKTIEAAKKFNEQNYKPDEKNEGENRAESAEEAETRAFENYIRGIAEERADVNLTKTDNGAVIPTSIANKIILKVKEISPLFQLADKYNVKGTLDIPYYDESESAITVAYADEFKDLESTSGKFKTITLQAYLAGALTKVSKSLVNNSQFDIVNFVIDRMAESIAAFIEKELLSGTTDKVEGLSGATQIVTAAAATAITADELIALQEEVPDRYQGSAIWIMNKATRTAIRQLKDGQGNLLLNPDATARWGYTLFGKDVYVSDQAPAMAAGAKAIVYGDMTGLAVKLSEDIDIEVLREHYAAQHAIGVVGWVEFDSKVEDQQKIAVLQMAAA